MKFRGLFISLVLLVFLSLSGVAFAAGASDYPMLIIVDTDIIMRISQIYAVTSTKLYIMRAILPKAMAVMSSM